jgi:hypothetical protein
VRDSDVTTLDTPQALPAFGAGAFRGSVVPGAAGPRPARADVGVSVADPSMVPAVRVSLFGAPNAQRQGRIINLPEYAYLRAPLSGQIFVADPDNYTRVVRRRMMAPPSVVALSASRATDYRAPMYDGVEAPPGGGAGAFRILGGR